MRKVGALHFVAVALSVPAAWPQASSSTVRGTVTRSAPGGRAEGERHTDQYRHERRAQHADERSRRLCFPRRVSRDPTGSTAEFPGHAEVRGEPDRPGAAGCVGGCDFAGRPDGHAGGRQGRHADGHHARTRPWATRWSGSASSNSRSTAAATRRSWPPCPASTRPASCRRTACAPTPA